MLNSQSTKVETELYVERVLLLLDLIPAETKTSAGIFLDQWQGGT